MISYQWGHQKIMKRIKECLAQNDIKVNLIDFIIIVYLFHAVKMKKKLPFWNDIDLSVMIKIQNFIDCNIKLFALKAEQC